MQGGEQRLPCDLSWVFTKSLTRLIQVLAAVIGMLGAWRRGFFSLNSSGGLKLSLGVRCFVRVRGRAQGGLDVLADPPLGPILPS